MNSYILENRVKINYGKATLGHGYWLFQYIFQNTRIYKLNVIKYCAVVSNIIHINPRIGIVLD